MANSRQNTLIIIVIITILVGGVLLFYIVGIDNIYFIQEYQAYNELTSSFIHKDIHTGFNWSWYEGNVLNISKKITVCSPPSPEFHNNQWKENGYSLIECYINPLFDDKEPIIEIPRKTLKWGSADHDARLISHYSICKLYNVFVEWTDHRNPFVNIHAYCNTNSKYNHSFVEKQINENRRNNFAKVRNYPHSFKLIIHENIQGYLHYMASDPMIYQIFDNVKYCGWYVWGQSYTFTNPWHCLDEMVRHFAINKYLNQSRERSVLFLPSYQQSGWRRNKLDISNRMPLPNYYYFLSVFNYFIPCQRPMNITRFMRSNEIQKIKRQNELNEKLLKFFYAKSKTLTYSVSELQINYFIDYQFQPFFDGPYEPYLFREFRKHLVSYFDSNIDDYKWIESVTLSAFMCIGYNNTFTCNNRNEFRERYLKSVTYINTDPQRKRFRAIVKQKLHAFKDGDRNLKLMFVGDRWVCEKGKGCSCERRRCEYVQVHTKWIANIIHTFSNEYIIIYGNPAYMSFETHYHLMRNADIFVSIHGAVFALSVMMHPPQKLFELSTKTANHLAEMLQLEYFQYALLNNKKSRIPETCDYKHPVAFNVSDVINHLQLFLNGNPSKLVPNFDKPIGKCN